MVNNSNLPFTPGQGGRLAVDRYDFQKHITGLAFRHTADQIDVLHPSLVYGNATNVEQALEDLNGLANIVTRNGIGFIAVPDGYDTYHNANGTTNFDPTIPSLDTFLNPLFQIIANAQTVLAGNSPSIPLPFPTAPTALPAQYSRIQYGGVVLIKSGTYIVKQMIQVPPGITLLGEGYGTKIVNASGLNTSGPLPVPALGTGALASSTPLSITTTTGSGVPIQITTSPPHGLSTGAYVSVINVNGNTHANTILNQITVVDAHNFVLNGLTGNGAFTSSPTAQVIVNNPIFFILPDPNRNDNDAAVDPTVGNIFMFSRETKITNLVISDNFVEPTQSPDLYYKAPQNLTSSTAGTDIPLIFQQNGSNLTLDGIFAIGRVYFSSGTVVSAVTAFLTDTFVFPLLPITGPNPTTGTILTINGCFIDGFAVPFVFSGLRGNKDFVSIMNSKVRAYGYLGGNSSATSDNSFLITSDANINIVGNHFYGNDTNIASVVDFYTASGGTPAIQNKSKVTSYANNVSIANASSSNNSINSNFQFYASGIGTLPGTHLSILGFPILIDISLSPYTVDTLASLPPYNTTILLVDSSTGAITINLPNANDSGQTLVVKDVGGQALLHNITLTPMSGQAIDGGAPSGNYLCSSNNGSVTLSSSVGNWWVI